MKGLNSLAPKFINQTSREPDKIADGRIRQVINDGGQKIEVIGPQIICGATGDVYKTPFRLLRKLGRQKFSQPKRKLSKLVKK